MRRMERLSRYLSYLLRHNPEDLPMEEDGFVPVDEILKKVKKRFPWADLEMIIKLSEGKGARFEIRGNRIRALYGHSIPVKINLEEIKDVDYLYHGTTPESAKRILKEGLKPMGRRKVHLSPSMEQALKVGKRKTEEPVVLRIDARSAIKRGIRIEKANDLVYLSDYIPPEFISLVNPKEVGS